MPPSNKKKATWPSMFMSEETRRTNQVTCVHLEEKEKKQEQLPLPMSLPFRDEPLWKAAPRESSGAAAEERRRRSGGYQVQEEDASDEVS